MAGPSTPIGVFDSGVGGLTVLKALRERLPGEDFLYLGDTARLPYGTKSPSTVERYAVNAARHLVDGGIKLLVVACNTASSYALEALATACPVPVVGVVEPGVRAAVASGAGRIGVIGTEGTIRSEAYQRALRQAAPGVAVFSAACPLFVPLAEEGWTTGAVAEEVARTYLAAFEGTDVDTLILGCTHYPLLVDTITTAFEEITHHDVQVLDSASATAEALAQELDQRGLHNVEGAQNLRFCATDDPSRFQETASRFFGAALGPVEHVDILDVTMNETLT